MRSLLPMLDRRGLACLAFCLAQLACAATVARPPLEPVEDDDDPWRPPVQLPPRAPTPQPVEAAPPGPEAVFMQVRGTTGTLDRAEVEQPFRKRWGELMRCFTETSRRQPWVGGQLVVQVQVDAGGAPTEVSLGQTIGAITVEQCVLAVVRTLRWTPPNGGQPTVFSYPMELRRRHAIVEQHELQEKVARRIRKALDPTRFLSCRPPPGAVVAVYVGRRGRVVSAGVAGAEEAATCITAKARSLRVPDPRLGVAYLTLPL